MFSSPLPGKAGAEVPNLDVEATVGKVSHGLRWLGESSARLFTRAVQYTEENLGSAPKTELEGLSGRLQAAGTLRQQTEKIARELESFLTPEKGFNLEKLVPVAALGKKPADTSDCHRLAATFRSAAEAHGTDTPLGRTLQVSADAEEDVGSEYVDFCANTLAEALRPLRTQLDTDIKVLTEQERRLSMLRLDLDAAKAATRRASTADTRAAADASLRQVQFDFDRQCEAVDCSLDALSDTPVRQAHAVRVLLQLQLEYHRRAVAILHRAMAELPDLDSANSESPGAAAKTFRTVTPPMYRATSLDVDDGLAVDTFAKKPLPHRARALYDYEPMAATELTLQAGAEVTIQMHLDGNWVVAECGGQSGKCPMAYLLPLD
eukprot:comp22765_c0_seq1/m.35580 comp22765_c0_seq1/g.35580  ORF comp22765_c0_seq1/g.35580 comp22765_c0_seq1/m.35580 type:complete len:378 (-) comp22765_c0_seq1:306-1439(-)